MSEVKTQNLAQCLSDHNNWFLVPQSFSFSNNPHKPHIKRKVFLRPFQNSSYCFNWLIRSYESSINVKVGVGIDRRFQDKGAPRKTQFSMRALASVTVKLYFLESEDFKESIKIGYFVAGRYGKIKKERVHQICGSRCKTSTFKASCASCLWSNPDQKTCKQSFCRLLNICIRL